AAVGDADDVRAQRQAVHRRRRQRGQLFGRISRVRAWEAMMRNSLLTVAALACSTIAVLAQGAPKPTCNMCPGTYIPKAELQAYIDKAIAEKLTDQQVRDVEIGKAHIGIGMVYRGKLTGPAPESVAEHHQVSEVYHIVDGTATLMLGPAIVGAQERPATLATVQLRHGPGGHRRAIRQG